MTNPRLSQIKDVLKFSEYCSGESSLLKSQSRVETFDKATLFSKVQASSSEISSALTEFGVVEVNNLMKLITPVRHREAERFLLDTILENSWQLDGIDAVKVYKLAPHIDDILLQLVFSRLGEKSNIDANIWILDFDKVAKACAHDLFIHYTSGNSNKVRNSTI